MPPDRDGGAEESRGPALSPPSPWNTVPQSRHWRPDRGRVGEAEPCRGVPARDQPDAPSLCALCGRGQRRWRLAGGAPGTGPTREGPVTPALSPGCRWARVSEPPPHKAGPREPLLARSCHPHWALLPPGANLGTLGGGGPGPFSSLCGSGPWVPPIIPQTSGPPPALLGVAPSGQWGAWPGVGSFPCLRQGTPAAPGPARACPVLLKGARVRGSPLGVAHIRVCTPVSRAGDALVPRGASVPTLRPLPCGLRVDQGPSRPLPRAPAQQRGRRGRLSAARAVGGEAPRGAPSSGVDPFPP